MIRKVLSLGAAAMMGIASVIASAPSADASTSVLVAEYRTQAFTLTKEIYTNNRCMVVVYKGSVKAYYTKTRDDVTGTVYRTMTKVQLLNPALDIRTYDGCGSVRRAVTVTDINYDAKYYYSACNVTSGSVGVSVSGGGLGVSASATIQCGTEYLVHHADSSTGTGSHFSWSTTADANWTKASKTTTSSSVSVCIDADYKWTLKVGTNATSNNTFMGAPCVTAT